MIRNKRSSKSETSLRNRARRNKEKTGSQSEEWKPASIGISGVGLFAFDSCYAGKHLSFDCFEEGTATCRYIANLVGHAELVDAGN